MSGVWSVLDKVNLNKGGRKMRIVLCCADYTLSDRNKEYSAEIGMNNYLLEIDSMAILPIGAIVDVMDRVSAKSMQFVVLNHWYDHENNILYLNMDIDDGEMSPKELVQYLERNWVT